MMVTSVTCAQCKCTFCIPDELYCSCKCSEKFNFYCPYGHSNYYPKSETEEQRLRRENQRLVQQMAQKDDEVTYQKDRANGLDRRLRATRGQVTRIKNRVGLGICPCCNRTFENLARHMASQHKDYHTSGTEGVDAH